jgi:hypothetical protein
MVFYRYFQGGIEDFFAIGPQNTPTAGRVLGE